jgi:hypothetical protein
MQKDSLEFLGRKKYFFIEISKKKSFITHASASFALPGWIRTLNAVRIRIQI